MPLLLVVLLHGWTVIDQRFIEYREYSDNLVYYVPLGLALAALVLLVLALRSHPCGRD